MLDPLGYDDGRPSLRQQGGGIVYAVSCDGGIQHQIPRGFVYGGVVSIVGSHLGVHLHGMGGGGGEVDVEAVDHDGGFGLDVKEKGGGGCVGLVDRGVGGQCDGIVVGVEEGRGQDQEEGEERMFHCRMMWIQLEGLESFLLD